VTLTGKRILLVIGGGIAAYKSLELVRRLRERGASVRGILTHGGAQFVTPLSVASLSEEKCYTDLFSLTDEAEMGHIRLSREADLVVVAPTTADLLAKMASGRADDLATTALLATDKPVLVAPAMNTRMWEHPATQRNLTTLRADAIRMIGPGAGDLACGEVGAGRMAEPADILAAIETLLNDENDRPLAGRRALVTAGPTHESIDPVRYLANRSSGRQGFAVAAALAELGAETTLIAGPTPLPTPAGVDRIDVESAEDMAQACDTGLPVDIAVCVAAVSDWRVRSTSPAKLKKSERTTPPALELTANPDILARLSARDNNRPALVVGFAAETENVRANAEEKRQRKGCDWILANDVSTEGGAMSGEENEVMLITGTNTENWPRTAKADVARRLARRIAEHFSQPPTQ